MRFRREHKLKIVSFLLALTLWYFVVLGKPVEKNLEISISLNPPDADYLVRLEPSNVVLKVEATRRTLRSFTNKKLELKIDSSKYLPGVYQLRVPIERLNLPSGVKIKEVVPNTVTLIIKKLATKRVIIKPVFEFEGKNHLSKFSLTIEPSHAIVKAPVEVLHLIDHVTTEPLNISKLRIIKTKEVKVICPPEAISVFPQKVKVIYTEKRRG